jgi:hypothetical protein
MALLLKVSTFRSLGQSRDLCQSYIVLILWVQNGQEAESQRTTSLEVEQSINSEVRLLLASLRRFMREWMGQ